MNNYLPTFKNAPVQEAEPIRLTNGQANYQNGGLKSDFYRRLENLCVKITEF